VEGIDLDWLLLIYTVPSQPSRRRAYVWRELKKLGGLYLRDGVAMLPRRPDLEQRLAIVAQRIEEEEGTVDLISSPEGFPPSRESVLLARFNEERAEEYRELYHACVRFLRDVLHEVDRDEFGFPDVDKLESELGRLKRWYAQVRERDYFDEPGGRRVEEILEKCDRAFDRFVDTASERETETSSAPEDVFERLGGPSADVPEDLPL
jgi:hypothetical protein